MAIDLDIEKSFGSFQLRVKLAAGEETLALLGPSGCGKSLTLKCIAGIERPDKGRIVVDGVTLFDSEAGINLPPQQRHTGLMFQNYALFPNMTVLQNIRTGASREADSEKRKENVETVLERFGLKELANRYPHQISGGEQQRTALARILVSRPRVLLLDEPFSALDSHLRFRLEQEVRQVIRQFGKTVLLVSHDRDEVFRMADRVAVIDSGTVQVLGPKKEVFGAPGTRSAAILTGCKNISRVEVVDPHHVRALDWGMNLVLDRPAEGVSAIGIRMHDIRPGEGENSFLLQVAEEIENPFSYTIMMKTDGTGMIGCEMNKTEWMLHRGESLRVSLPPEALLLLRD